MGMHEPESARGLETLRRGLERQARRWARDDDEAEELVQEVMVRCWLRGARRGAVSLPYARRVLRNLLRRQWRRGRMWQSTLDSVPEKGSLDGENNPRHDQLYLEEPGFRTVEDRDFLLRVLRGIERLPIALRVVCRSHWIEGTSYDVIARALGINEITVRGRCHRARRMLLEDRELRADLDGRSSRARTRRYKSRRSLQRRQPGASDGRSARAGR